MSIGGMAVGTGLNAHPEFGEDVLSNATRLLADSTVMELEVNHDDVK